MSAPTKSTILGVSRRRVLAGGAAALAAGAGAYGLGRTPVGMENGVSRARPVTGDTVMPSKVDVVVIGGGFVGASTALTLAERGVSVALCEKGVIAGEASGRSMGFVDIQYADPDKLPLMSRSKSLWQGMNARTGFETGYRRTGLLSPVDSEEERAGAQAWLDGTREFNGIDGRIVSGEDLKKLLPGTESLPAAALFTESDASVDPRLGAPAIAEGARRRGAIVLQQCAVRGLDMQGGKVSGVVTEKGRIACQAVVLAGGSWTSLFCGSLDLQLPQFNIFLSMMGLTPVNGPVPATSISAMKYGLRKEIDGGYAFGVVDFAVPITPWALMNAARLVPSLEAFWSFSHIGLSPSEFWHELSRPSKWNLNGPSPFEERRILVPEFRAEPLERALELLRSDFPAFRGAQVRERWAGATSSTLDNTPIISRVSRVPGLYVGSGFSFGLTMGPAAGEALADLVMNRTPHFDLASYRFERFSDGTALRLRS